MMKADLRPAGSFIQNPPTTAAERRHSVATTPSRLAETTRTTPAAAKQVPAEVRDDEGPPRGEADRRRRSQRPSSAWKSRHRRPRFTDNFDVFDDPVVDLDIETPNTDGVAANAKNLTAAASANDSPSSELKSSLGVVQPGKDPPKTPTAWQNNNNSNYSVKSTVPVTEHRREMLSKATTVAKSNYGGTSQHTWDSGSENWTSSAETSKRNSVELIPGFELSHIRAKVMQKFIKINNLVDDRQRFDIKLL